MLFPGPKGPMVLSAFLSFGEELLLPFKKENLFKNLSLSKYLNILGTC